jgi:hypothetical protein
MRKYTFIGLLIPPLLACLVAVAVRGQEKSSPVSIEGDWRIIYQELSDNRPSTITNEMLLAKEPIRVGRPLLKSYRIEKNGTNLDFSEEGVGRMKLDPGGKLGAIDTWLALDGGKKSPVVHGIYRMKDGFFFTCYPRADGGRPTRFAIKEENNLTFFIMRKGIFK